jgi:SAM-dependent methyltransferase
MSDRHLRDAFSKAQPEHYAWQTRAPYVADRERELCRRAFMPLGRRVLDVGCGEGGTLHHLGEPDGAVGVDLFDEKVAFARAALPRCTFTAGSAYQLPFERGRFDQLIVRDVIHHLDEPQRFVTECARVLEPGGRVDVLEPCVYNPVIFVHAVTKASERGELRSTPSYLCGLFERGGFRVERVARMQPFPLHRLVFHLNLGWPAAGANAWVAGAVAAVERAAAHLVPRVAWAYIHVRLRAPGERAGGT